MALDATELAEIEALLAAPDEAARVVGELRRRFPAFTVTRCDLSDLGVETPFRTSPRFSLYLVDSADHCWRLTSDAARATGLVLVAHKVSA